MAGKRIEVSLGQRKRVKAAIMNASQSKSRDQKLYDECAQRHVVMILAAAPEKQKESKGGKQATKQSTAAHGQSSESGR